MIKECLFYAEELQEKAIKSLKRSILESQNSKVYHKKWKYKGKKKGGGSQMKISIDMQQKLRCPSTKTKLKENGDYLESVIDSTIRYPIIDGIPAMLKEKARKIS